MNRKEEIKQAAYSKYCNDSSVTFNLQCDCFSDGAEWADRTMIEKTCPWIKFTEQLPHVGTTIIVAVKNKNKPDGIWLYDICEYYGGDVEDNNNWEGKRNWEKPIYWAYIDEPK